jgi:hypothetical protein
MSAIPRIAGIHRYPVNGLSPEPQVQVVPTIGQKLAGVR